MGIALNLISAGFYDIAVRDLVMAVGAFRLAHAAEAIAPARARVQSTDIATARRATV